MSEPTEKEIKVRAYQIWERLGCPKDKEEECWQAAVEELRDQDSSSPRKTPDTL
ncbi:DUF2934 domain-containing protein [Bradyrhizobium sp. 44]|uniref:DUF2934 domain-containing protein n=1 Tax=unclassified Bradyrhizobium TaxID=2631580 RepID=UPI001FFBB905|nr:MULTISPECIES: DUF2934 domain-containing protein [unclassified Bradyrhizobium]MCK1288595.1 DUF2934 domain-containing protein [Bradyrhizobium sp. 44]UPJ43968.1 DUF2934 domain-containing protein [Bradyrhizobium sp. 40]